MTKGKKRVIAAIVGIAMFAGVAGLAAAETVTVDISPAIVEAYEEYGVGLDTLLKPSSELDASERRSLDAIFGDDEIRAALNGVVLSELWDAVEDEETIATVTLAGRVYQIGMPEAFE